jgi:hypothetical protein
MKKEQKKKGEKANQGPVPVNNRDANKGENPSFGDEGGNPGHYHTDKFPRKNKQNR